MAWDFADVGSGATNGAATGSAFGPWGAAIGGVAGGLMGGFMGKPKAPNFSDIIAARQSQIDQFQQQLTQAQNSILSNYQNLQSNTMKRFMPDVSAYLGGRGLSSSGGAFASAVAHEATGLEGQYDAMNANMTERNLSTIGSMRQNLFSDTLGLQTSPIMMNYQNKVGAQQAFGNLLGSFGSMGMKSAMSSGGGLFGGGQQAPSSMPGYESFNSYNNRVTGASAF